MFVLASPSEGGNGGEVEDGSKEKESEKENSEEENSEA